MCYCCCCCHTLPYALSRRETRVSFAGVLLYAVCCMLCVWVYFVWYVLVCYCCADSLAPELHKLHQQQQQRRHHYHHYSNELS